MRSAEQHSSSAFIASNLLSRPIVDAILPEGFQRRPLENAFSLLRKYTGNVSYTSVELLPPNSNQHSLSHEVDSNFHKGLLSHASPRHSARLHSLSLKHAGGWLDAIPSPSLNLHMDTRSFTSALGYRLGLSILKPGECRALNCDQQLDALGDHALHCHDDNGLKTARHDRIRDMIHKEAQHANLNPTKEMPGIVPNSQSRPADVYVESWIDGRKVAFDVSVVSPTQEAILHRAAEIPGAAIEMRKTSKNRTHFDHCRGQGVFFQPLVVETFGGWDSDAVKFLKEISRLNARRWARNDALEIKYFFQRLSVSLQRGNAALLVNRDADRSE